MIKHVFMQLLGQLTSISEAYGHQPWFNFLRVFAVTFAYLYLLH